MRSTFYAWEGWVSKCTQIWVNGRWNSNDGSLERKRSSCRARDQARTSIMDEQMGGKRTVLEPGRCKREGWMSVNRVIASPRGWLLKKGKLIQLSVTCWLLPTLVLMKTNNNLTMTRMVNGMFFVSSSPRQCWNGLHFLKHREEKRGVGCWWREDNGAH